MSRSSPTRRLYCEPCKASGHFDNRHFNIRVERRAGNAAICRCLTCGHTYRSSSRAAMRALHYLEK